MPSVLGRYEVRAKIGEGGMAMVYVGCDPLAVGPARVAALKIIKDELCVNREFVDMLGDEARIVAKLSHPNVIKLFEAGDEKGRVFLAMELLLGQSLWEVWAKTQDHKRRFPYDLAAWMGARIADGLHHAHEHTDENGKSSKIVHRDVNPHNVFVTYDGQIKIIDFGMAKAINRVTKTGAGIVKGKLGYLAPEQATSLELDRRADVFALSTTLWELTTNRRLFRRDEDIDTLRAIFEAVVPDPRRFRPDYPPALWTVLQRGLARDRDERYPTALALGRDLDAFAASGERVVDAGALATFMSELFPDDRERQREWLDDATRPSLVSLVPLKVPVLSERQVRIKGPVSLPEILAPPLPVAQLPPPPPAQSRALVVALVLLGVVLAVGIVLFITQG
jgi:serine/threonine-protein kinase